MKITALIFVLFLFISNVEVKARDIDCHKVNSKEKEAIPFVTKKERKQKKLHKLINKLLKRLEKRKERKVKLRHYFFLLGLIIVATGIYVLLSYSVVLAIILAALSLIALIILIWLIVQIGTKIAELLHALRGCFGCFSVLG